MKLIRIFIQFFFAPLWRWRKPLLVLLMTALFSLTALTYQALLPFPEQLTFEHLNARKIQIQDRAGQALTITYQNRWNLHDYRPLHEIPQKLQQFFVLAEDKRFYEHTGVDWLARLSAIVQNLKSRRIVRGASTITEQSVRMLHPRPRTFWSRWVETIEAMRLEMQFSKADILEFYLNQIDYVGQRRGVAQASQHYFDRDLDTLNDKEMMALAVLVRSPSRMDLRHGKKPIDGPIQRLGQRLIAEGKLDAADLARIMSEKLQLKERSLPVQATHFVNYLYQQQHEFGTRQHLTTTLDSVVQQQAQDILDSRLQALRERNVHNGAVLVVDHWNNEILAWVNSGDFFSDVPGSQIDAVITPRQPGSTLKPLLYATALEKGWTAATLIEDAPLAESVGTGLHSYQNYSRSYYGPLRLRDALGNSLNTPAVRTVQFVGTENFLRTLHQLGFNSLEQHPNFYGDGLALGNGGVTLFELVQAYAVLANQGVFHPLQTLPDKPSNGQRIFSAETSSLIANILSDPDARRLEFGLDTLLRLPVQTAVKTGTSNDYHDAWAVGFNHHYLVGVWMGNLDQEPMQNVSGSIGPALVLRSLFAELNRHETTRPLYLSPRLVKAEICRDDGRRADGECPSREEWFIPGTEPHNSFARAAFSAPPSEEIRLRHPTPGLQMAMDPRIPDQEEAFALELNGLEIPDVERIEWVMDDEVIGETDAVTQRFLWYLQRGQHVALARVWQHDSEMPTETPTVSFYVK